MEDQEINILDAFTTTLRKKRRRALLPWWIKTFTWICLVLGVFAVACFVLEVSGIKVQLALYGLEAFDPKPLARLSIVGLFILKGIAAFALWTEKHWAIELATVDAILGIAICSAMTVYSPWINDSDGSNFNFRLELLLLIPFLFKLRSIKAEWNTAGQEPARV